VRASAFLVGKEVEGTKNLRYMAYGSVIGVEGALPQGKLQKAIMGASTRQKK